MGKTMKKLTKIILPLLYLGQTSIVNAEIKLDESTKNIIKGIIDPTPNIFGSKFWDLDSAGTPSNTENFQYFGTAVSSGDYNNDGYEDLAVGIPGYDFFTLNNTGTVLILYGTANGLSGVNSQFLFQTFVTSPPNVENDNGVEANDFFGTTLASGDFNCDGFVDLAVGTPDEDVTLVGDGGVSRDNVGAVNIFYGSASGFADNGQGSTFLLQGTGTNFFSNMVSDGDKWGFSMAVGNFNYDSNNGNQCMDLAISAPYEDFGNNNSIVDGGQVDVLFGSASGIDGSDRETISQNSAGVADSTESNDLFGYSLAAGNLGKTVVGIDLAVGVPGEKVNNLTDAGIVQVFYSDGENGFMTSVDDQIWSQDSSGVAGLSEAGDKFGSAVVIANFDGAAYADLAISATEEDLNSQGITNAGAVNVLYSTVNGLTSAGNQLFYQLNAGLQGDPQNQDRFGETLTAGDLNYDGVADLVVGVPSEAVSSGAFHVIYGVSNSGLTTQNDDYFENSNGGDQLSISMAIGDFGNGPELATGMPAYNSADNNIDSGAVQVFEFINPDVIFKDDFEN